MNVYIACIRIIRVIRERATKEFQSSVESPLRKACGADIRSCYIVQADAFAATSLGFSLGKKNLC